MHTKYVKQESYSQVKVCRHACTDGQTDGRYFPDHVIQEMRKTDLRPPTYKRSITLLK